MRLPHPRTGQSPCLYLLSSRSPDIRAGVPSLFLPYEDIASGKSVLLEVQAVSPPNRRSWFIAEEVFEGEPNIRAHVTFIHRKQMENCWL